MAYDFSSRLDTLGTRMKELHQNSLTYKRVDLDGNETSTTITNFTPERVDVEQLAAFGITLVTNQLQDFAFDAADLSSFSPPIPERGDKITWGTDEYEVMAVNDQVFVYTTSSRKRIIVHTKRVGPAY